VAGKTFECSPQSAVAWTVRERSLGRRIEDGGLSIQDGGFGWLSWTGSNDAAGALMVEHSFSGRVLASVWFNFN